MKAKRLPWTGTEMSALTALPLLNRLEAAAIGGGSNGGKMKSLERRRLTAASLVTLCLLLGAGLSSAGAQTPLGAEKEKDKTNSIRENSAHGGYKPIAVATKPEGLALEPAMPNNGGSLVPPATRDALSKVQMNDIMAEITEVEWRNEDQAVVLYASNLEKVASAVKPIFPPEQKIAYIQASISRIEMEATAEGIVREAEALFGSKDAVVYVAPAADASSMKIGLKTIDSLQRRALPTTYAGIKLDIEFTAPATPVTRVRTSAPIVTGGYMESQDSACTTGFPVMRNDGVFGNISADHCDDGTNNPWKWGPGGTLAMGSSTGQADPGSTDLEIFLGTASGSFIPYIYTGNNNDSSNVLPIRGYYNAAVGDQLCYSGAYSGMVCGNEVTSTGVYNCYEFLQCYWLGTTKQVSGLPSVGNGDSGGPAVVFAARADGSVGAYGAGIISGIFNITTGHTNCIGDPGYYVDAQNKRLCGPDVFFSPLVRWAPNQSVFSLLASTN
jgi:hypothetical protein